MSVSTLFQNVLTHLESAFSPTALKADAQDLTHYASDALTAEFGPHLSNVLSLADKAVATAELTGQPGDAKWTMALSLFNGGIEQMGITAAEYLIETLLQLAVTKLKSIKVNAPAPALPSPQPAPEAA